MSDPTTPASAGSGDAGAATSPTFATLEAQYFYLDQNFNRLFMATTTDDQRDTLRNDYVQARENYWQARNRRFHDDDPMVADLQRKAAAAQRDVAKAGEELDDVAGVLTLITDAVNLGSRLVSLAVV